MTNRKSSAKRSFIVSLTSLVLCVAMLLGTTFAWFSETITSGNNIIQSGNLDVELDYYKYDKETKTGEWISVAGVENIFDPEALWEPGYTEVVYLRVRNAGSLALKYNLDVSVISETGSVNVYDENFKLSEYIRYGVDENVNGENAPYADRAEAISAVDATSLPIASGYAKSGTMVKGQDDLFLALVVYMPTSVGNEANYKKGADVPTINLGIRLVATQNMNEEDSYGSDYDKEASAIPAWDGATVAAPEKDENDVYHITSAAELAGINDILAKLPAEEKANFVLDADINLGDKAWTPIGLTNSTSSRFEGTFDGNGYTIYNVSVAREGNDVGAGLFGSITNSTIKNLTIKNVDVEGLGDGWAGGLVGISNNSNIINCKVLAGTVQGLSKVGGIVGDLAGGKVDGCKVDGLTIAASEDRVGGIAGRARLGDFTSVSVVNNVVTNTAIYSANADAGEILGVDFNGQTKVENNTHSNVTVTEKEVVIAVGTKEELIALGGDKKSYEGTIVIENDIDLLGADMPTIGAAYGKSLTVEGNGHTISNANLSHITHNGMKHHGLFYAYTESQLVINDLTVENVNIDTTNDTERNYGVAVIVCYADGDSYVELNNVDVNNCTVYNNNDEAAVYVGYQTGTLVMTDCDSTGCSVEGETEEKTGAFVGMVAGTATLNNCTTDLTIGACNRVSGTLTVNGGYIPKEYTASTKEEIEDALDSEEQDVVITLDKSTDLSIDTNSWNTTAFGGENTDTITINANGATLNFNLKDSDWSNVTTNGAKLIINDAHITSSGYNTGHWKRTTVMFSCEVELNNVTADQGLGFGNNAVLNNVTINKARDEYALWIKSSGQTIDITDLKINSEGRAIKIADEDAGTVAKVTLNIDGASFKSAKKAAILVTSTAGADITLKNIDISGCAADTTNAVWVDSDRAAYYDLVTVTGGTKLQET